MSSIEFDRVSVVLGGSFRALNELSLRIEAGELVTVVGPSGSGKSTLLRTIAGLEHPAAGRLLIGGEDVREIDPRDRNVAMVFQDHALYSHRSAAGNLSFPLELRHVHEPEKSSRIARTAGSLGLSAVLDRLPRTLSLGQRNAVATGRALIREPDILLLDEPLANFDARARLRARVEVRKRHSQTRATTVYATNDQAEAMAVGDRIVVLNRGTLQQVDAPAAVYDSPGNLFVARFIGTPPMNAMSGRLVASESGYVWSAGDDRIRIPGYVIAEHPGLEDRTETTVVIGIRPEHLFPSVAEPFDSCVHGTCLEIEDQGSDRFARVDLGYASVVASIPESRPAPGVGNRSELAVDVDRLHFFDAETGRAL